MCSVCSCEDGGEDGCGAGVRGCPSARAQRFFAHPHAAFLQLRFCMGVSFAQKAPLALLSSAPLAYHTSAPTDPPDPSKPLQCHRLFLSSLGHNKPLLPCCVSLLESCVLVLGSLLPPLGLGSPIVASSHIRLIKPKCKLITLKCSARFSSSPWVHFKCSRTACGSWLAREHFPHPDSPAQAT